MMSAEKQPTGTGRQKSRKIPSKMLLRYMWATCEKRIGSIVSHGAETGCRSFYTTEEQIHELFQK